MLRHLLPALLLAPLATLAQTTYQRRDLAIQPEVQAELSPDARSYAYVGIGGLRFTDYNTYASDRKLGLDAGYLALGYERQFAGASNWSWGPTLRIATQVGWPWAAQLGALLRHRSVVGPLAFGQRLGAEVALTDNARIDPAYVFSSAYTATSRVLLRLRFDLHYNGYLHVSNWLAIDPRLSFEPALFLRLQRDVNDADKRTIDYTGLRADVALRFAGGRVDVTPFFALQTRYYQTLVQFTPAGMPTSNGKLNSRLPVAGVELRFPLQHEIYTEGHFELPTQHEGGGGCQKVASLLGVK